MLRAPTTTPTTPTDRKWHAVTAAPDRCRDLERRAVALGLDVSYEDRADRYVWTVLILADAAEMELVDPLPPPGDDEDLSHLPVPPKVSWFHAGPVEAPPVVGRTYVIDGEVRLLTA